MNKRVAVGLLSLSATGLVAVANFEGFSPTAYIPIEGDVPTIGFGHTNGVEMGQTVTVPAAMALLNQDISHAEKAVKSCVNVPLTQRYYDVLVSFAYNIGGTAFCTSTLVKKLNQGDYTGACKEILRWDKIKSRNANGEIVYVPVAGLTNRRKKESAACLAAIE